MIHDGPLSDVALDEDGRLVEWELLPPGQITHYDFTRFIADMFNAKIDSEDEDNLT